MGKPGNKQVHAYTYMVRYSAEDAAYVVRVKEFHSLSAHGDTPTLALYTAYALVNEVIEELGEEGAMIPAPRGGEW